ncbi:putative B3 domain-containing protein [Hirschfeldia incana]|nr:putative B3 domain-containing protein [Hirschfeldia incana]
MNKMILEDPPNPAVVISKKLTRIDLARNVKLPKQKTKALLTMMNGATTENLQVGKEVKILDYIEGREYTVILRSTENGKYHFGDGWSTMKNSLNLQEGEILSLYWDYRNQQFIII